jgi:hypothetical protein
MTIREIVVQGIHSTRACTSLWVFGFVVGAASASSNGGGKGNEAGAGAAGLAFVALRDLPWAAIAAAAAVLVIGAVILRYVSEGALIEGVVRSRQGGSMTTREGLRAGWAHWGVLLRIALLYFAATVGSLVALAVPCVLLAKFAGVVAAVAYAIPALLVAVPWLVTIYLVQAFASRIAVLEDRHALDAIAKARLFLHGRLAHALKVIVASFIGTMAIAAASVVAVLPIVVMVVAFVPLLGIIPVAIAAVLWIVPVGCVLTAMLGTFQSSVWTIGYVSEAAA